MDQEVAHLLELRSVLQDGPSSAGRLSTDPRALALLDAVRGPRAFTRAGGQPHIYLEGSLVPLEPVMRRLRPLLALGDHPSRALAAALRYECAACRRRKAVCRHTYAQAAAVASPLLLEVYRALRERPDRNNL